MYIFYTIIILSIILITYLVILQRYHSISLRFLNLKDLFYKKETLDPLDKNSKICNVLFLYPHPDDETAVSGGLISILSSKNEFNIFAVSTTKGENGNEITKFIPEELGALRKIEYKKALKFLGVENVEVWDFSDGNMTEQKDEIKEAVKVFILKNKIDVVVTYEKNGIYSHPDHIILSQITHELSDTMEFKPLYASMHKKMKKALKFSDTITIGDDVKVLKNVKGNEPEMRVFVFKHILNKYRALKAHKSQKLFGGLNLLYYSLTIGVFEYYSAEFNSKSFE